MEVEKLIKKLEELRKEDKITLCWSSSEQSFINVEEHLKLIEKYLEKEKCENNVTYGKRIN